MATATLTSKGQITIHTSDVNELKGMFGIPKKSVSIEAMNQAIAKREASAKMGAEIPRSFEH